MKIESLRIEGFGKFSRPFEMSFSKDGVQVILGENESGKSTLMKAILAIIFGLTERQKEQILPWHGNGVSTGQVILSAEKNRLLIERDFLTDIVGCALMTEKGEKPIFSDRDIAGSRGERPYLKLLSEYIPVTDPEVFQNTTFFSQKLIGVTVPNSLKKMITGTIETNFDEILNGAIADYFKLSADGDSIKEENKSDHQILEQLEEEHSRKKQILAEMEENFRGQNTISEEIESLEYDIQTINRNIENESERLNALEKLCEFLQEESQLKETHQEVFEQRNAVTNLEREIVRMKKDLEGKFPQLHEMSVEDLNEDVNRWLDLITTRNELEESLRQVAEKRREAEEKIQNRYKLYRDLEGDFLHQLKSYADLSKKYDETRFSIKEMNVMIDDFEHRSRISQYVNYSIVVVAALLIGVILRWTDQSQLIAVSAAFGTLIAGYALINIFVVKPSRNTFQEMVMQRHTLISDEKKIEVAKKKIEAQYYNVPQLDNYEFHFEEQQKFQLLHEVLQDLVSKERFLLNQLSSPEIQGKLFRYEKKYHEYLEITNPDIESLLQDLNNLQKNIDMKQEALETHKEKEYLDDRDQELIDKISSLQNEIGLILEKYPEFDGLLNDEELLNNTNRNVSEALDKFAEKLNSQSVDLQEKLLVQARMEGQDDVEIERLVEDIMQLEERIEYLKVKKEALALVINTLKESVQEYNYSHKDNLNRHINSYLKIIAGKSDFSLEIRDNFQLAVHHNGVEISEDHLSLGMLDQIYLAMRFAFAGEIAADAQLPFFLDDPFVNCDRERLPGIRKILEEMTKKHQVVLFTIDDRYKEWCAESIVLESKG